MSRDGANAEGGRSIGGGGMVRGLDGDWSGRKHDKSISRLLGVVEEVLGEEDVTAGDVVTVRSLESRAWFREEHANEVGFRTCCRCGREAVAKKSGEVAGDEGAGVNGVVRVEIERFCCHIAKIGGLDTFDVESSIKKLGHKQAPLRL